MSNIHKTASSQDIELAYVADFLQRTGRKVVLQRDCVEVVASEKPLGNKQGIKIVNKARISNMDAARSFVLSLNP